jgi:hypothetical protein
MITAPSLFVFGMDVPTNSGLYGAVHTRQASQAVTNIRAVSGRLRPPQLPLVAYSSSG